MENLPANSSASQICIVARLSEVARLGEWAENFAASRSLPAETAFALRLCLEELAANTILHGHGGDCEDEIAARLSTRADGAVELILEDHARHFNPVTAELPPALDAAEQPIGRPGGQGLRLLRGFASSIAHEALPSGNRVTLTFQPPRL